MPIINRETFGAVQAQLNGNAAARQSSTNSKAASLLAGLVYDETRDQLCPTHASKKAKRYRYYISKRLMHRTDETQDGWRVPARELEQAVKQIVDEFLRDELPVVEALHLQNASPEHLRRILHRAEAAAEELKPGTFERQRSLLSDLLDRVILGSGSTSGNRTSPECCHAQMPRPSGASRTPSASLFPFT